MDINTVMSNHGVTAEVTTTLKARFEEYEAMGASPRQALNLAVEKVCPGRAEMTCTDCRDTFPFMEGRPYKYEPGIWLCEACHDLRMEEDEDDEEDI